MKCIWCLDGACFGTVRKMGLLERGIIKGVYLPICEKHMEYHKDLVTLVQRGYNIEDLLDMPAKNWRTMVEQEMKDESAG